ARRTVAVLGPCSPPAKTHAPAAFISAFSASRSAMISSRFSGGGGPSALGCITLSRYRVIRRSSFGSAPARCQRLTPYTNEMCPDRQPALQAGGVARDVPRARAVGALPARAGVPAARGVVAATVDDHVGVPGVGVDGDPASATRAAPGHQLARVARAAEAPGRVQHVRHRARAVIAGVVEGAVA